jgi:S1-C subfamily serine protease
MFRDLISNVAPAVMLNSCPDINSKGTGFLVTPDGLVVTNNHVIASQSLQNGSLTYRYSTQIEVTLNGTPYHATIECDVDSFPPVIYDYAILRLVGATSLPHLQIEQDLSDIHQGDRVLCLGYPLDFAQLIVTSGIVSAVHSRSSHVNSFHSMRTFVTDALIQFGNSGGPMIHADSGRVIGINTLKHSLNDVPTLQLNALRMHLVQSLHGRTFSSDHILNELIGYVLRYTHVGLNHAVSIEYASRDANWPTKQGGTT